MKPAVSTRPRLASQSCLPPVAATSGWVRVVEGQGRKLILHEPPALFSVVHRVLCVCVLRECADRCLKGQKQDVEVSGRRKRRREAACSWEKEIWKSRNRVTPHPPFTMKMFAFGQGLMAGAARQGQGRTVSLSLRCETQSFSCHSAQRSDWNL